MAEVSDHWEEHSHEAMVHHHGHYHVTHNYREMTGGFEHLSSYHEHEHDHAAVTHSHFPHEDFDREHEGEAHVHDHSEPARPDVGGNGSTKAKRSTKKAAKSTT